MVDLSAQKCSITPVNPTDLTSTGGVLKDGTKNVTVECKCNDGSNNSISDIKWLTLNNQYLQNNTSSIPYSNPSRGQKVATLLIPVFNYIYEGNYTCHPNGRESPMSTIQLLSCELTFFVFCSIKHFI